MCGIVGLVSAEPTLAEWLAPGVDALRHRGPDGAGLWVSTDSRVHLGHTRLAVVDLSPAGAQPMEYGGGRSVIAFNGEIYNHVDLRRELVGRGYEFRTKTDTEVVLAAFAEWGSAALARLEGMFAFALFDATRRRAWLARDRAGEKPLFYRSGAREVRFASELKALLADPSLPRTLSAQALDRYLYRGFVSAPGCLLEGFSKVPGGHFLEFDLDTGASRLEQYWSLPAQCVATHVESPQRELANRLQASVELMLEADVPVGVLLSGGLDSSIVTALAARSRRGVNTFNVAFRGHGALDESAHARRVAEYCGTRHLQIDAEPPTGDELEALAAQFDEPIIDSSMIPTALVSRLVRKHCTVVLGGDGGDELFGGYRHYQRLARLNAYAAVVPRAVRRFVASTLERGLPQGVSGLNWVRASAADFASSVPEVAVYLDRLDRDALLPGTFGEEERAESDFRTFIGSDLVDRATRHDFAQYLAEDILVKVDRASMLSSIEMRAPFLHPSVIEFAFASVASHHKCTTNGRKVLLKTLARELLPGDFDFDRKQGFSVPLADWLREGPMRALVLAIANEKDTFLATPVAKRLWLEQERGRNKGERIFGLLLLDLWCRQYRIHR